MEQWANTKFCVKLEKKFAETYELMKKVYGYDYMSRTQVYTWFTRFKNGREDLNDDLFSEVSNQDNVDYFLWFEGYCPQGTCSTRRMLMENTI